MSGVSLNGNWYYLNTPRGRYMTFDPEELEEAYIEDQLWAWSRLLDFVKARDVS